MQTTKHLIRQRQKCQLSTYGIQFLFPHCMSFILNTILLQTLCNKQNAVSAKVPSISLVTGKELLDIKRQCRPRSVCTYVQADQGLHCLHLQAMHGSRNFCRGAQARWLENSLNNIFFLVLNLFYNLQRGSNDFITEKTILFQGSRGGSTFSRGGPTFSRGVQMLISIETHITCDFPVGVPDPLSPPLDPHIQAIASVDNEHD